MLSVKGRNRVEIPSTVRIAVVRSNAILIWHSTMGSFPPAPRNMKPILTSKILALFIKRALSMMLFLNPNIPSDTINSGLTDRYSIVFFLPSEVISDETLLINPMG